MVFCKTQFSKDQKFHPLALTHQQSLSVKLDGISAANCPIERTMPRCTNRHGSFFFGPQLQDTMAQILQALQPPP